MAAVRRPGYDQAARMLATGCLVEEAAKIDVPTAVLVGSKDGITPPHSVRRAFESLPQSARRAFREFPGVGHAICQEEPATVANVIAAIIEEEASVHA